MRPSDVVHDRTTACGLSPDSEVSWGVMPEVITGDRVGRYTIVERIGSGGMGVVYRAHDPELDRDVALKVLRADREQGTQASRHAARLLREARTLARLSHPHVVAVFDVGTIAGAIFIAMEIVEGQTLRAWMKEGPHPIDEVLEVFEQAGEGLVAAHREGLVHRDFKPDNVLMRRGPDGRWACKVVDFGLARLVAEHERSQGAGEREATSGLESLELTAHGTVVGTPAYMAPEQHRGLAVVPASDQYSFCVALFEAVRGHRPFRGATYRDLVTAKRTRRFVEAPTTVAAPPHVERVISRGLEPNPDDRWPSMDALLAGLRRQRASRRWRAPAIALAGVSILGLAWGSSTPGVDCGDAEARLAGVWDPATKAAVRDALLEEGGPNAMPTWARVEQRIDAWTERWGAQHDDACAAARDGTDEDALLDLRSACLDGRRTELMTLVDVLRTADRDVARHAIEATAALPTLTACSDETAMRAVVPPPEDPVAAAKVRQLRVSLSEARSLAHAGRIAQADELAQEILPQARALAYAPLVAEALEMAGRLRNNAADYAGAESLLTEGYWLAREVGHDAVAASIGIELVLLVGEAQARFDDALEWAKHAEADLERAGPDPALRRRFLVHLGVVHFGQGDLDASERVLTTALSEGEAPEVLIDLGNVLARRGQLGVAREHYQRAADLAEAELGPDHPQLATAVMNVGSTAMRMGDIDVARAQYERAIGIYERSLGPNNPELGNAVANLGISFAARQEYGPAQEHLERAAGIWEASLGPDHPVVAQTKNNLARMLLDKGDPQTATPLLRRALEIEEKTFGADATTTVVTRANLAQALLGSGHAEDARPHAERAVELARGADVSPSERGVAEEALAEVAWALGRRDEALRSARAALQSFADAPDDYEASVVRLRAWLDERAG